jgi:hypothetical protein
VDVADHFAGDQESLRGLKSHRFQALRFRNRYVAIYQQNEMLILMVRKAGPSETLGYWIRAAQARRVASMLFPRDAQLAESYAAECEAQAR